MKTPQFKPGFRLSIFDILILTIGSLIALYFGWAHWVAGVIIAFVVIHFFFFCNVFRISRTPELIWAVFFTSLAVSSILQGTPSWLVTFSLSVIFSSFLIWRETRKKSYHGVLWRKLNPELPEWWEQRNQIDSD